MKPVQRTPRNDLKGPQRLLAAGPRYVCRLASAALAVMAISGADRDACAQTLAAIAPPPRFAAAEGIGLSREYNFIIGRLPLESALDLYQQTTGTKLFYDSQLVMGRISPGVTGHYSADEALSALLANTNLYFVRTAHDIVTLVPMHLPPSETSASSQPAKLTLQTMHVEAPSQELYGVSHYIYGTIVEGAIRGALQQERALKQRHYNADIFVWVSRNGALQRFQLANSTGNTSVDELIEHALDGVVIRQAPPSDLPQPLHVRIRTSG